MTGTPVAGSSCWQELKGQEESQEAGSSQCEFRPQGAEGREEDAKPKCCHGEVSISTEAGVAHTHEGTGHRPPRAPRLT